MGYQATELSSLVNEIKLASASIEKGDARTNSRCDEIERSVNELFKRVGRPGQESSFTTADEVAERKSAAELCVIKHNLTIPKNDGNAADYTPSSTEIDEARLARKAVRSLFRHGDQNRLPIELKKSLTSFSFGTNDFILPPEMSDTVLSCLVDPTDITGLVNNVNTSSSSIRFMIDNVRMADAGWACETNCFANNPQRELQGLGFLEIKVESLRYVVCASVDTVQDAAFNIEGWVLTKASEGFRRTINAAIIGGDGMGKPMGILHPDSGIPILDTSPSTPEGQFTWQDLVMLKYDVAMQYHAGGSYLMNQRTFALLMTMSDAIGRPLWGQLPGGAPGFLLAGSPIVIVSQMPDCVPGATPVAYGNWRAAYTLVNRRATTMLTDPFSGGWCLIFRFDARLGGAVTCGNAARLLRIR